MEVTEPLDEYGPRPDLLLPVLIHRLVVLRPTFWHRKLAERQDLAPVFLVEYPSEETQTSAVHQLVRAFNKAIVPTDMMIRELLPIRWAGYSSIEAYHAALIEEGRDQDASLILRPHTKSDTTRLFIRIKDSHAMAAHLQYRAGWALYNLIQRPMVELLSDLASRGVTQFYKVVGPLLIYPKRRTMERLVDDLDDRQCAACGAEVGGKRCIGCGTVHYCGVECQRERWPVHRHVCKVRRLIKLWASMCLAEHAHTDTTHGE